MIDSDQPSAKGLPAGPKLTAWITAELNRTAGHPAWINVWRALAHKHRCVPTYVTNPTGPDIRAGWHCQDCGLDRDGPHDEWPCEVVVMIATALWRAQRPEQPVAVWEWAPPAEGLVVWRGQATG
jgi:hypothetical protein